MFNCRTYILKKENKADHLPSFYGEQQQEL